MFTIIIITKFNTPNLKIKVLIALGYFAGYPFQEWVGLSFHIHRTTVSRIVSRIVNNLTAPEFYEKFVRMPNPSEVRKSQLLLYRVAHMPGNSTYISTKF